MIRGPQDQSIRGSLGDGTIRDLNCVTTSHQRIRGPQDHSIRGLLGDGTIQDLNCAITSHEMIRGSVDHSIRASEELWVMAQFKT